jgi:CAAX protease family protein
VRTPLPRPAFDAFIAPARTSRAFWRTVAGTFLIMLIYAASFSTAVAAVAVILGPDSVFELATSLVEPHTVRSTLFLFSTFVGMAAGPIAVTRMLHHRSPATLFGRAPRVLRDFVVATLVVGGFCAVTLGLWSLPYDAEPGVDPRTWLAILPLALVGILIQTGAEELVFRGYMMQQLAARFRSPLIWMVVPSVLFGLVHYAPAMSGGNALMLVAGATLFGLFAADLTAVSGSLGAAWGFHFANNVAALAILATDGTITGVALYVTPYAADSEGVVRLAFIADYVTLAMVWGLCRLAVRR